MNRGYFLSGWLAMVYSLLMLAVPFWGWVIYTSNYTWHEFLWLAGIAVFVTLARAYQYFIQKR